MTNTEIDNAVALIASSIITDHNREVVKTQAALISDFLQNINNIAMSVEKINARTPDNRR